MKDIKVQRPCSMDVKELHELFKTVIVDTMDKEGIGENNAEIEKEINEKNKFLKEDLESNGVERFFLIARNKDKIVGTIAYGPCGYLIKECSKGKYNHIGEIGTVFVLPEYQNKGIGTILMNFMFNSLKEKDIDEFCLDSGYTIAKKIWQKKLGEPNIIMKDFWGEGYDHYIWHRSLRDLSF